METSTLPDLSSLTAFRQTLHRYPELSGAEEATAARILEQLQQYKPTNILTQLGGTGLVAVFEGDAPENGPTILFRSELDALPISEDNPDLAYTSAVKDVAHLCGHDGHMAILLGLASLLHKYKPARGRVLLLFQPAEETGAGARDVLQDERLLALQPDFVFALHNLPGWPLHQVVVREQVFASASTGMIVELQGYPSHAAEPENGLNPGEAMAEIILSFNDLIRQKTHFEDLTLLTVVHARLGEVAFGTNPGYGTVMATLRSYLSADLQKLKTLTEEQVQRISQKYNLKYKINFVEEFPATVNDGSALELVRQAAEELGLDVQETAQPFRWSEDFGHFTGKYKGALFGLGAGTTQPQLHHANYNFPDELIPTGATMFYQIVRQIIQP
ncbi:amidohydrolase [Pontibacter chinhatensis]|uniref:Amidohydrolase n=1 Tax=Pontibacter chinhatensis TaxID=1436961 RepID=A0A1I2LV29_9BACT|nr:amidohydrolase [Pontibacter chinhatensis]SFF83134.1 amidohydrolase [Pontibacter chinhatensis]